MKIKPAANGAEVSSSIPGPRYIDVVLLNGTATTMTAPVGTRHVMFSASAPFYVNWDGAAAAIHNADVTDGSGSELNPAVRSMSAGETFSIIGSAGSVSVAWLS
jgi:hypothetical protein